MMQAEAGKGSKRRNNDNVKAYSEGWERIFGKKETPQPKKEEKQQ